MADGAVVVDERSRSTVPSIYAVGDVTNRINLTPVAIREGQAVATSLFGGAELRADHVDVPSAVFSQPPIGTVGVSEEVARERYAGQPIKVYQTEFVPLYFALGETKPKTAMKPMNAGTHHQWDGFWIIRPSYCNDR